MATALLAVGSTGEITPGTKPNTVAFDLLVNISGHTSSSSDSTRNTHRVPWKTRKRRQRTREDPYDERERMISIPRSGHHPGVLDPNNMGNEAEGMMIAA